MGNTMLHEPFSFSLAEARKRATQLASLHLYLQESILLLMTWILPIVLWTARSYYLLDITVTTLKTVYNTALGIDSWDHIAQESEFRGVPTATPKVWLDGLCPHVLEQPTRFSGLVGCPFPVMVPDRWGLATCFGTALLAVECSPIQAFPFSVL